MSGGLDVAALAGPIIELLASFGPGGADRAVGDALRAASAVVEGVQAVGRGEIDQMYDAWRGPAGDAAMDKAMQVQTAAATVSDRGNAMAEIVDRASGEVAAGQREVAEILHSFVSRVQAVGTAGLTPAGIAVLVGAALEHIGQALRVVERVRVELEADTAAMSELIEPPPIPPPAGVPDPGAGGATVVPAGAGSVGVPQIGAVGGAQFGSAALSTGRQLLDTGTALASDVLTVPAAVGDPPRSIESGAETWSAGAGVLVTLPDGSSVGAPNQQAADAVRNALGAVGTPYVWGGNTPGVGLDCSGLTQWAYAEAGVSLPGLAQEQGDGHQRVDPGDLMPGDLVVWDGHVAMVIGNGQLVEAGDPVQVGPIRTENAGMRFLGFYRPTA
ncbi:bifunctional WXG100 family type VII secretion target/C40 family peptidase [Nocardia crassostreae]|uniref:bifunctional WXG100 family type VII secretion target/C40 family peptidase n=1 Tax=Nocardia crassostreae TaxID=53428 RepID=UPI00082F6925|nr:C40 family peptidase [Nocardia crassostreae]